MFMIQSICCIGHINYSSDGLERSEKFELAMSFNVMISTSIKGRSDFTFGQDAFGV